MATLKFWQPTLNNKAFDDIKSIDDLNYYHKKNKENYPHMTSRYMKKDYFLNKAKRITFYKNGDKYFAGKTITFIPSRYATFKDLMKDLNKSVDLPYGVRRVYSSASGREIFDIDELNDNSSYVCASFEPYRHANYGSEQQLVNNDKFSSKKAAPAKNDTTPNANSSLHSLPLINVNNNNNNNNNSNAGYYLSKNYIKMLPSINVSSSNNNLGIAGVKQQPQQQQVSKSLNNSQQAAWTKPRLITIIRATIEKPRKKICILLNRKALHSFEQLICDISEAFGLPQWRNDKIRKLFTVKGRRVQSISDFFRDEDTFIGVSSKESLTQLLVYDILQELYPTNELLIQGLIQEWNANKKKASSKNTNSESQSVINTNRDSGYGDAESSLERNRKVVIQPVNLELPDETGGKRKSKKKKNDIVDIESQRQQERLRLIEEAQRKRDEQQSKAASTRAKSPEETAKRVKRRPRLKKEEEPQQQHPQTTPTHVLVQVEEQQQPAKEVVHHPAEKTHHHHEPIDKMRRQISNESHIMEKYDIVKVLGDGNFAVVKQAKLKNSDNEYAIKIIDKSKMKGKEGMIDNEINIMKSCNHPNIVKLFEEYETKNEVYLITELVKGGDLFDAITQSVKFSERDASYMIQDLSEALFYLHSKTIVHRDLKPENLLVLRRKDERISIKLADFGLAMEVKQPIFTVCGTPTYVAPEILSETGYGLEVDMWACGVIMYILLCGFPPFRSLDRNQEELFQNIQSGEFEYLMPYWEGISESSKDLINHLLVVDKSQRWKAENVLAHQWILTHGNSSSIPNFDEYRKSLVDELKAKSAKFAAEPLYSRI